MQQIGACIAYIVIIGDVLTDVLSAAFGTTVERYQVQLSALVIIFPLTLLRHMDSLK